MPEQEDASRYSLAEVAFATVVLGALALLFWSERVIKSATEGIGLGSFDVYTAFIPRAEYVFGALANGHLPLWNPYQLCGAPLLAVPATALFYPLNVPFLFFDVPTAIEISLVLHMGLGGVGMWCLQRRFGVGMLGALCAAVTFMWSGWIMVNVNQPILLSAMAWMPLTVLLLDRTLDGERWSWLGLASAVTAQILTGATEVFIHVMYVGVAYTLFRLVHWVWLGHVVRALRRGTLALVSVGAGILLAAPQLLPSLELVRRSARAPGALTIDQVSSGAMPPWMFVPSALGSSPWTSAALVGTLPLLGMILVLGFRRHRLAWMFGLAMTIGGALLVFGGPVFQWYYATPLGSLFRRPMKFLDVYAFGQALIAGLTVARLQSWSALPRTQLWRHPAWLLALAVGVAVFWSFGRAGTTNLYRPAMVALLALFGVVPSRVLRVACIVALCALQGHELFTSVGNRRLRPAHQPGLVSREAPLMKFLRTHVGHNRVYISGVLRFDPALGPRQGMLNHLRVVTDYDPLVVGRYAEFFDRLSGRPTDHPFDGVYGLGAKPWGLMKLTSTKYFVIRSQQAGFLAKTLKGVDGSPKLRRVLRVPYSYGPDSSPNENIDVYEASPVLPRAFLAAGARVVADPEQILSQLEHPSFVPRRLVLLEEKPQEPAPLPVPGPAPRGAVRMLRDEPEDVTIAVPGTAAAFLVLTDLYYPGWTAFVDGREVPIHRANYLFRAVWVPEGAREVRFLFRPTSFRVGLGLATVVGMLIIMIGVGVAVRGRQRHV